MSTFDAVLKSQNTKLCLGIDPDIGDWSYLPTQENIVAFAKAMIDEGVSQNIYCVKFQSAYFEALGNAGFKAMLESIQYAKSKECFVILDAKRGDIASSMTAYGRFAFDIAGADFLTTHGYFGPNTLLALEPWLKKDKGVYVVWISSNTDAALIQDQCASTVLDSFIALSEQLKISSRVGFVLGATQIEKLSLHPQIDTRKIPLLLPGLGFQGGTLTEDAKDQLLRRDDKSLFPVSRGIIETTKLNWKNDAHSLYDETRKSARQKIAEYSSQLKIILT